MKYTRPVNNNDYEEYDMIPGQKVNTNNISSRSIERQLKLRRENSNRRVPSHKNVVPSRRTHITTSKYKPHQGTKECGKRMRS